MAKPYVGVWVDRTHAFLVWADGDGSVEVQRMQAQKVERGRESHRAAYAGTAFGAVPPHADLRAKQRRQARLFYENVVQCLLKAQKVYLFGPGLAKQDLGKQLARHKDFHGRLVAVESAEKMTEPQMVAHVRKAFGLPYPEA